MTRGRTALDSNVLSALFRREPSAQRVAGVLGELRQTSALVICPVVYAELLAGPGASAPYIRQFLLSTGVTLGEHLPLKV